MSAGRGTPRVPSLGTNVNETLNNNNSFIYLPSVPFNGSFDVSGFTPVSTTSSFQSMFSAPLVGPPTRVAVVIQSDTDGDFEFVPVFDLYRVQEVATRTPGPPLVVETQDQVVSTTYDLAVSSSKRLVFAVPPIFGLAVSFSLEARSPIGAAATLTVSRIIFDNLTLYGQNTLL